MILHKKIKFSGLKDFFIGLIICPEYSLIDRTMGYLLENPGLSCKLNSFLQILTDEINQTRVTKKRSRKGRWLLSSYPLLLRSTT